MAQLAILGHETRGKEVIEILEMLGGHNYSSGLLGKAKLYYYIGNYNSISYISKERLNDSFITFTLEKFLEKFPYKVRDKVVLIDEPDEVFIIDGMKWKNNEILYDGHCISGKKITISLYSVEKLLPYKPTIEDINKVIFEYHVQCNEVKNKIINKEQNTMERNVKISLEKAREWYNSGNESLREVALQAFKEEELRTKPWKLIKTFEDACRILNINPINVSLIPCDYLRNIYKLQIIKKALNGAKWEPNLNTGIIYYPWLKYYPKGSSYNSWWTPIANFKAKEDNKVYTLVGGDYLVCSGGLSGFRCESGYVYTHLGLLSCKSEEIAKYFSKTFGKLIFDVTYGQYNNYIWID